MGLRTVPVTFAQAREFVAAYALPVTVHAEDR
jgi:hypothetical protein